MKKLVVAFLVVLSFVSRAVAADQPLGVEQFTSIEELAVSLSSYFPKVHGEIKAVAGDRLTLSLAKKDGLLPGMVLTIWRDGKEILHPVTNAIIGRTEDEVGTAEVVDVNNTSAVAVMKKKLKEPVQGDKVRITPRKINVALLPLKDDHPQIVQTLGDRLREFGRFNVLDQAKVDVFAGNAKVRDAALVRELGTTFGLDAVISLGFYPSDGKQMVTARIFYTEDASQLDTLVAMLDLKTRGEALGEIKPFFTPGSQVKEERSATPELPFLAQSFTAGDFDGDGKLEYAFSDGTRLHIYRNEPSGWREVWTEVLTEKQPATMEWQGQSTVTVPGTTIQHINIDSADINGNGRPEIFVTAMVNGKVNSYVLEYGDGSYRRIADLPGFLRVVTYPGSGSVLLGQAYDPATFFAGGVRQYTWSEGSYRAGADVAIPRELGLYGWTFANFGERQPLLVALNDDDHLEVYSGGALVWKSADQYPAVDTYVYRPATGVGAMLSKSVAQADKSRRMRLRGRVIAADVNGDGRDEIILPKNISGTFIGGFSSAELYGMTWTGARLDPAWSIRDIPGPVFDFRFLRSGSGSRVNALVKTKGSLFTRDRQQVMIYSVK